MSSKIRLVKKATTSEPIEVADNNTVLTEQQRNRQMVKVVKSWIDEFKVHSAVRTQTALALMNR